MKSLSEIIEVGKRIQIVRLEIGNKDEYLISQILDIHSETKITIAGPIKKNILISIHKGELINLYFTVENIGSYSFTAKVISRKDSPVYTLNIEKISEIIKIQQREYFRLPLGMEVNKSHKIIKNHKLETYSEKTEAKDISGGGMRINCNYKHEKNDKINCSFKVENKTIKTDAIIKRVEEIDTFDYKYGIGVAFLDIDERDKDEIIRYIFNQQRILRNKGMI